MACAGRLPDSSSAALASQDACGAAGAETPPATSLSTPAVWQGLLSRVLGAAAATGKDDAEDDVDAVAVAAAGAVDLPVASEDRNGGQGPELDELLLEDVVGVAVDERVAKATCGSAVLPLCCCCQRR